VELVSSNYSTLMWLIRLDNVKVTSRIAACSVGAKPEIIQICV